MKEYIITADRFFPNRVAIKVISTKVVEHWQSSIK